MVLMGEDKVTRESHRSPTWHYTIVSYWTPSHTPKILDYGLD